MTNSGQAPPPPNARVLPNEFEMLQSFFLNYFNRLVDADFRDDIDIDSVEAREGWPSWTTEQQVKYLCRCKDIDTGPMMLLRLFLFQFYRNELIDPTKFLINPVETWKRGVVLDRPQLQLVFYEKNSDQKLNGRNYPLRLIVSIRLPGRSNDYTWNELKQLNNKIKLAFTPFKHYDKARTRYVYRDPIKGYDFKLLLTEIDAKEIITNVMSLQSDVPEWEKLSLSTKPEKNFNARDNAGLILGKQEYYPDFRPLGKVWLHSGQITLYPKSPFKLFNIKKGIFYSEIEQYNDIPD